MEYYIHYECPKCDGDVYSKGLNLCEHNGIPVFSLDGNSCTTMTCDNQVWKDPTDETITEEEYKKLPESEQEKCYKDDCNYQFGTGDIDVLGEDEW